MEVVSHLYILLLVSGYVECHTDDVSEHSNKEVLYQFKHVGNPDDILQIERPCPVYDLHCIRNFFSNHANCSIKTGPVPDPYPKSQISLYLPSINTTMVQTSAFIYGLNRTSIEEFYINKATNKVVFAIHVSNIMIETAATYFIFYRSRREPVTAADFERVMYSDVTFTAVIPNIDEMQLEKAEMTAYVGVGVPIFVLGPGVTASTDPQATRALTELMMNLPLRVQEAFLVNAGIFPPIYIQYNICDFGLKLES